MQIRREHGKATPALLALALLLGLPTVAPAEESDAASSAEAVSAQAAADEQAGEVVARVNGAAIARDDLEWEANAWLRSQGMDMGGMRNPGAYRDLERRVLDRLIKEELILQAARDQGVTVGEELLESRMRQDEARYGSPEEFATRLESFGLTLEEHRQRTQRQLRLEEYVRLNIQPEVDVEEARVDAVYADYREEQQDEAQPEEEVRPLIRSQLEQQVLAQRIGEHLQALEERSEVEIHLR